MPMMWQVKKVVNKMEYLPNQRKSRGQDGKLIISDDSDDEFNVNYKNTANQQHKSTVYKNKF